MRDQVECMSRSLLQYLMWYHVVDKDFGGGEIFRLEAGARDALIKVGRLLHRRPASV